PLDPPHVHPQQHLGPVLRLGAPGAGMNRQNGVLAVVLAAQHLLDLAGVDQTRELVDAGRQLAGDILALAGPFDEHTKILGALSERIDQLNFLFDPPAALKKLLCFGLIGPEVGRRGALFYAGEFFGWASGLNDSSGGRRRASPSLDICGSVRRWQEPMLFSWALGFRLWALDRPKAQSLEPIVFHCVRVRVERPAKSAASVRAAHAYAH